MNTHDATWLLFASPVMVLAAGIFIAYVAARQDRDGSGHGR